MEIIQARAAGGMVKSWPVDLDAIKRSIRWARQNPQRLELELTEMIQAPLLKTHVSTLLNLEDNSCVWLCRRCSEVLVFWDGLRCPSCEQVYNPAPAPRLAFFGRIPSLIGRFEGSVPCGRPVFKKIMQRLGGLAGHERDLWQSYLLHVGDEIHFAPLVISSFSADWPLSRPNIYFRNEYWRILDIPVEHTYGVGGVNSYELCNFASWRRVTMRVVLQQRILPRVIIDLMLADLKAAGKLDRALRDLGTGLYDVYNWIGKGDKSEKFRQVYGRYVTID